MYGYRFYNFNNPDMIKEYLEAKALKGYRLVSLKNQIYKFERIEPTRLYYDITYLQSESAFDADNNEEQQNFIEFCEQGGWEYRCSWQNMKIFSSEEKLLPIDTDPQVRFDCIHRTMKKTFLVTTTLLLLVCVLNLFNLFNNPLTVLTSNGMIFTTLTFALLLSLSTIDMLGYWVWYFRCKSAIREKTPLPEIIGKVYYRTINPVLYIASITLVILGLVSTFTNKDLFPFVAINLSFLVITIALALLLKRLLKRVDLDNKVSWTIFILFIVAVAIVQNIVIIGYIFGSEPEREEGVYTYETEYGETAIYSHDIPLRIEDLGIAVGETNSYHKFEDKSFLLHKIDASQASYFDNGDDISFGYLAYKVDNSFVFDIVFADITEDKYYSYNEIFDEDWSVDRVYQLYNYGEKRNSYLLIKGYNIAIVHLHDIEPNYEQKEIIAQKLL